MNQKSELEQITASYFAREWARWPSSGSRVGLIEYDERLEVPTPDLYADQIADLNSTRRELQALPDPPVGSLEQLDRQAILAHIEHENLFLGTIEHWRTDPIEQVESAIGSIFGLLMRRDVSKPEAAEAIRKRLAALPEFLEESQRNLSRPIRMWVRAARPTAQGGVEFFKDAIPPLARQHRSLANGLESAMAAACIALAEYDQHLQKLENSALPEDPAVGEQVLQQIVRTGHGLPHTLDELDSFAGREIDRCKADMDRVARTVNGNRSWQQILEDGRRDFASEPHDLMQEYRAATLGLRDQLVCDGVLDLPPGETCDVMSTPAFLRSVIPSAAYSSPGPLDAIQRGIYYVTEPPPDLPASEFQANLGQHFCFESTCAHEAYPGHHVQLCWANHASSIARQMAHHIIFMEGWTLYCEQLVVDLGYLSGPIWELDCLLSQLWRACRIRIDVRVHSRRMSVREAIDLLKSELGFTELRAQTELNWYTQSPGTPMSYLLGRHETFALRDLFRRHRPQSSLRDFHNWLLQFGSVPQRWLHPLVGEGDEEMKVH
jgi:uncharacterized protein (DUF885 family)